MTNEFIRVFILIIISIGARTLLIKLGQRWIATFAHTATIVLLPIITFVITKVISGNIALSLGMVGALSIVRFRNPVKSPLELSVYFAAITLGITASADENWGVFFVLVLGMATIMLWIFNIVGTKILKKPIFVTSFSEGNSLATLEIVTSVKLDYLDLLPELLSRSKNEDGYEYMFGSSKIENLNLILFQLDNPDTLISYKLDA